MMTFSVIVPDKSLVRTIESQLAGVEFEIIVDNWRDGYARADGQFICFLEKDSDFRSGFFVRGLLNMLIKPSFRKLAMVAPAVEEFDGDRTIYGYRYNSGAVALVKHASTNPYPVQVGYVPGSIIRRSALAEKEWDFNRPPLELSVDISLYLWENGQRVHLDPGMIYQVDLTDNKMSRKFVISNKLMAAWKRESV